MVETAVCNKLRLTCCLFVVFKINRNTLLTEFEVAS